MIAASTSTETMNLVAGRYVGKDDPVMIVRAHKRPPLSRGSSRTVLHADHRGRSDAGIPQRTPHAGGGL